MIHLTALVCQHVLTVKTCIKELTEAAFFAKLPLWLSKSTENQVPDELAKIVAEYGEEKGALIPVLQKVQEKFGYLPEEAISEIAKFTRMSESEIFGVASFYAQFYFTRRGQHTVKVHKIPLISSGASKL